MTFIEGEGLKDGEAGIGAALFALDELPGGAVFCAAVLAGEVEEGGVCGGLGEGVSAMGEGFDHVELGCHEAVDGFDIGLEANGPAHLWPDAAVRYVCVPAHLPFAGLRFSMRISRSHGPSPAAAIRTRGYDVWGASHTNCFLGLTGRWGVPKIHTLGWRKGVRSVAADQGRERWSALAGKVVTAGYLTETDEAGSVPPGLQDFLNKAEEAVRRRNYGYAIAMYRRILVDMPGNLWVRRRLRATELKRDQEGGRPNLIVGLLTGLPALLKIVFLGLLARHQAVLKACEAFLVGVPTNIWVLRRLAHHAAKLGFFQTAIFSLENALEVKHENVPVLIRLAELYDATKQSAKAAQFMQLASSLRPSDRELAKRANNLVAANTIAAAKLDETETDYTKSLADAAQTEQLTREQRLEKTEDDQQRLIRRYTEQAEANPDDPEAARRLAGAYRAVDDWDNAFLWYKRASELAPKDFDLKAQMAEMRRRKYLDAIRRGEQAVAQNPDNAEYAERLARLRKEFSDFELSDYQARVAAYPTNMDLKYELGMRLFERGEILQAIQQFQRSVRSVTRGRQSRTMLGRCFMAQGHPELAKEQFRRALEDKEVLDDAEALSIYYDLAEAHEALGEYQEALENFGKIYTVDVMFKDVAERMDKARALAKGPPAAGTHTS